MDLPAQTHWTSLLYRSSLSMYARAIHCCDGVVAVRVRTHAEDASVPVGHVQVDVWMDRLHADERLAVIHKACDRRPATLQLDLRVRRAGIIRRALVAWGWPWGKGVVVR